MNQTKGTFSKKKLLAIVFIAAAVLLAATLLKSCGTGSDGKAFSQVWAGKSTRRAKTSVPFNFPIH